MKILVLADQESKYLWDYFEKSKVGNRKTKLDFCQQCLLFLCFPNNFYASDLI